MSAWNAFAVTASLAFLLPLSPNVAAGPQLRCTSITSTRDDCVGGGYSFTAFSNEARFQEHSCGQWILQNHAGNTKVRVRWYYIDQNGTEKDIIPSVVLSGCHDFDNCKPFGVETEPLLRDMRPVVSAAQFGLYLDQYSDQNVRAAIEPLPPGGGTALPAAGRAPSSSSVPVPVPRPAGWQNDDLSTSASGFLGSKSAGAIPVELRFVSSVQGDGPFIITNTLLLGPAMKNIDLVSVASASKELSMTPKYRTGVAWAGLEVPFGKLGASELNEYGSLNKILRTSVQVETL